MMRRSVCLTLVLLAGCSPTPKPLPVETDKAAEKPEVRFAVSVKPTKLEVLNGQQVEPTVVLYWKIRSHWAKGADPEVSYSARVEPADRGVTVTLSRTKDAPPPADKEIEIPLRTSIGVGETAPAGVYIVEITATIPGGDPRSAKIEIEVPRRK